MSETTVLEFRAMGSPCRIVVDADASTEAAEVRRLIWLLEDRWSRFLATSEVSALNRAAGRVTVLSEPTYKLVSAAVQATDATGGLFNPLMLYQLESHGYREPWSESPPTPSGQPVAPATTEPIVLYPEIDAVRIPEGCRFDPGGIGKGLAIDLAVELCQSRGLSWASIELGGDLKVYGLPWYGPEWTIGVANPFQAERDIASFTISGGAVTTSTTMKRRWSAAGRHYHHLLDPGTGQPSASDLVSVTTCSEVAWWAEVVAKSALLAGSARAAGLLDEFGIPGAMVTVDGSVLTGGRRPKDRAQSEPPAPGPVPVPRVRSEVVG